MLAAEWQRYVFFLFFSFAVHVKVFFFYYFVFPLPPSHYFHVFHINVFVCVCALFSFLSSHESIGMWGREERASLSPFLLFFSHICTHTHTEMFLHRRSLLVFLLLFFLFFFFFLSFSLPALVVSSRCGRRELLLLAAYATIDLSFHFCTGKYITAHLYYYTAFLPVVSIYICLVRCTPCSLRIYISIYMPRKYRYQRTHTFAERQKEVATIRGRFPQHVPVVCEPASIDTVLSAGPISDRCRLLRDLDCSKFLVPGDASMQQLMVLLRSRLVLDAEQAIFLFIDDAVLPNSACVGDLYAQRKDADGFLYMTYSIESAFGGAAVRRN
ncbi:microtubial binding protein, putative [Trypanosoma cruzi]|uniref:Autophagy-related protein n=2 Tax=Trypanosoma cruzi TaxID=5693 RepID=Q4DQT1_TRYCC|nr:microtubial binding protein, putative [Trypanosoma cruzi]EAN94896.1 microtubial binding protein, putative [Trypanosoma cruzi]|eukprot:XP_816747.1 microtubial binding protein [Trypanosoma cruzi strain CL Brener]